MVHLYSEYEFDESLFEIRRGGVRLEAPPRVFDVVLYLYRNRHRVVSKKELRSSIWSGLAVTDGAIEQAIRKSRLLFESGSSTASPIRTVRRRGYRFVTSD